MNTKINDIELDLPNDEVARLIQKYGNKNKFKIPKNKFETFEMFGIEWELLVTANEEWGGVGNFLITPRQPVGENVRYHNENKFVDYLQAEIKSSVDKWFDKLPSNLKKAVLRTDVKNRQFALPHDATQWNCDTVKAFIMSADEYRYYYRELNVYNAFKKWFWLRSAGDSADGTVSLVDSGGLWNASSASLTNTHNGFRPAIWVNLNSEIFKSGGE